MEKSRWIWYGGDYEIYHSILLHSRREEMGREYPSMWALSNVAPRVSFRKEFDVEKDGYIRILSNGKAMITIAGKRYARGEKINLAAGHYSIFVEVTKISGLPAIYCDSDILASDRTWTCTPGNVKAGDEPAYFSPDDDVEVFPFEYTEIKPVSVVETASGTLYDFGKELFAKLDFACEKETLAVYGETAEEATDPENAIIREKVPAGRHSLVPRAFRYVCFSEKVTDVTAWLELLPEKYIAKFSCDRPEVEKIFDVCAYTFHLNSREFLLDGIKRDRWCWSGDAYQSYMVNDYLFADRALNRRTITALLGKPPYYEHINHINDYSALLLIGIYEYYFTTGDAEFIKFVYPRAKGLFDFITSRLDENGLVAKRENDWIFIDWSEIDKDGPLCAEQILLWQTYNAMAALSEVAGEDISSSLHEKADRLKKLIFEKYWDDEKQAFIDSFTSGKRHVTRHSAIFAILFDLVDRKTADLLVKTVLENDEITKITTPYFELYELMALCKLGHIEAAQEMIDSYWGGMLRLGATTIWEQYDPTESGIAHYRMYGCKFGKSLCHAWGSGPIYLLGRYCLGVRPTSVGSKTFTVEPNPGVYKEIHGVVPMRGGSVRVDVKDGKTTVFTELSGGTLIAGGKEYAIEAGKPLTV